MTEEKIAAAEVARKIVEEVFGIDILHKSRVRERVDARMVYAKILRQSGLTTTFIAKTLGKDHSTVVHYCSIADNMIETNKEFKYKYKLCYERFNGESPIEQGYSRQELIENLISSKRTISELDKEILMLKEMLNDLKDWKYKKEKDERLYGKIFQVIRERTPLEQTHIIERRVHNMFNTHYIDD